VRKPRVVAPKPNQEQKDEIYGQLLNVTDIDKFDKEAFADARGINYSSLGGMIGQMINRPFIYIELRKKGFTDVQIPSWVMRPAPGVGVAVAVEPPLGPAPAPAAAPATIVTLAQENAASERVRESASERVRESVSERVSESVSKQVSRVPA
jgi:hypothetical protein